MNVLKSVATFPFALRGSVFVGGLNDRLYLLGEYSSNDCSLPNRESVRHRWAGSFNSFRGKPTQQQEGRNARRCGLRRTFAATGQQAG
jgi:hypothetical protein